MKKIITLCLSLCMTAALAAPAYALEYSIDAPDAGLPPGAWLGVRYSPVWRAFMLSEPNAGGISAAFLLMSAFFIAPPSAVWMTSMEVVLPKS